MCQLFMRSLLAASVLILAGCHTMFFEISDFPQEDEIKEDKSFFLWGLVPNMTVDVLEKCPFGAAAIKEETTFDNGFASLITLGIWSPRETTYYCLREN